MGSFFSEIRFAARGMRRNPAFASTAILILAVGMGATTAIFSVVDRLLFRGLPYADAERLVALGIRHPLLDGEFLVANDYLYLRERMRPDETPFTAVTSWTGVADCDLTEERPQRLACAQVESSFLPTFGIRPVVGRNFTREDDLPNAPTVTLISYGLWQSRFAGDPRALGRTMIVDGVTAQVVGVLPRDFELPTLQRADMLVPQALRILHYTPGETGRPLRVFGRLKPGVTTERARAMLQPYFRYALEFMTPQQRKQAVVSLASVRDFQIHDVKLASWVLFGATLAILLIVCANVANLLLARFAARQKEFAMRLALGAGRMRLAGQTLAESLLLCVSGAAAGCGLAWAMLATLRALAPAGIPRIAQAALDGRVLLFASAATLVCGFVLGLAPVLSSLKMETLAGWRTAGQRHGMRSALAAAQIAVSLVLLSDAGLLLESLWRITQIAPGVDTEQVLTADITVGAPRYPNPVLRQQFFDDLTARLRANPLVLAVAVSDTVPPSGFMHNHPFSGLHVEGRPPMETGTGGVVWRRTVSPGYFKALGIPIVHGRGFREDDLASKQNVMVISATLAKRLFPGEDPLGRIIRIPNLRWVPGAVVGVAADADNSDAPGQSEPEYYLLRKPLGPPPSSVDASTVARALSGSTTRGNDALLGGDASLIARALHAYDGEAYVIVRSSARPDAVAQCIREAAASLDSTVPVTVATMRQRVRAVSARPRFDAFLLALFAGVGVLLSAFGLYGLVGYLVVRRTQEIGVRMALGATPRKIAGLVLSDGLRWTAAGVVMGLAGAALTARSLAGILFGVHPENLAIFALAAALLTATAIAATLAPALRAARIDPLEALRRE